MCSLSSVVYSQLLVYKLDSLMHMFLNVINCARMPFIAQECYQLYKNAINCARIPEQASQTSVCTVDCTGHTICPPHHAPAGPAESVIEECWLPCTAGNRSNKDTKLTLHWYHVESVANGTMLIHMYISGTFATTSDLSMWNWLVMQTCTASRTHLAQYGATGNTATMRCLDSVLGSEFSSSSHSAQQKHMKHSKVPCG